MQHEGDAVTVIAGQHAAEPLVTGAQVAAELGVEVGDGRLHQHVVQSLVGPGAQAQRLVEGDEAFESQHGRLQFNR
jgi:hypothetical protein